MIASMPNLPPVSLDTRILDLPSRGVPRLGPNTARKLALGLAGLSPGKDISTVSVEDLLHYLPMRYEDRSSLAHIRDLSDDMEASRAPFVKFASGYQMHRKRSFSQRIYNFEISETDRETSGIDVIV